MTSDQQTSITGALMPSDVPPWIPHKSADNETAIAAVIKHMQRDALRPCLMNDRTGPVHLDGACGNFLIASAGFRIYNLTAAQRSRLVDAWAVHKKSRHYQLAVQLERLAERSKEAENNTPHSGDSYKTDMLKLNARSRFLPQIKLLETEAESIYKVNAT